MDKWIRAASLPATLDLAALSAFLHQRGIVHRITEEQGRQVIWVASAEVVAPLNELLEKIQSGEVRVEAKQRPDTASAPRTGGRTRFARLLARLPVTFTLLLLSLFGFIVVSEMQSTLLHWFTFQDFVLDGRRVVFIPAAESLARGELWRLITPIFLHFGIFHILFNGLWVWEFGRRIETLIGPWRFINLVLLIGLASNLSQYFWENLPTFGGMSGVIYGLLGYIWQRHRLAPDPALAIPPGIIGFMLVWLVVCMLGGVSWLTGVQIANAAHLGGLIAGMLCGLIAGSKAGAGRR